MLYVHINEFFFPFFAGPSKHISDVIQFTFQLKNHILITFDFCEDLNAIDNYNGISIYRFTPIRYEDLHRFINLGIDPSNNFFKFVSLIRDLKPDCIILYFIGLLPLLIRQALPEVKIVYMPFGFLKNEFNLHFRSNRMKIALCGDNCKEDFIKAGVSPKQIHIIERPININYYKPFECIRDPNRLLIVGRFHPVKRIHHFIRILDKLTSEYSDLYLHIIADTNYGLFSGADEEELKNVKTAIQECKLNNKVFLRGRKIGDELLREYSEASIHILPSTHDRRATVVQEAITMGMQCICTCKKSYDWPEYAEDGRHLIHYVDEIEDIIPVLRKMLDHPEQYHSNRDYALEHWSWEKWAPEYEKLMTEW
jgi:glycosyltransferase involved in cell wall biosynthesis